MQEQTAIMVDVRVGRFDYTKGLAMGFTVALDDYGSMADQVIDAEKTHQALVDANVTYVTDLEGKPCIVERDGNIVTFVRMWKGRKR